jgi:FkbM family methyltransferase
MKSTTPALFRFVKLLNRWNIRGSYRLLAACRPYWVNDIVTYKLSSRVSLAVPIWRRDSCLDLQDILEYERDLIEVFSSALRSLSNVTLLDCGADIGLFSAVVCSRCACVARVLAFEPNPDIQAVFRRNIESLPKGEAHALAISSFEGFGILDTPSYDDSEHARYLVQAQSGIPVVTLDSLGVLGGDVAIKIDVEGGELGVLHGARETIRQASHCVLSLEVHPKVCDRTGVAPSACMAFLASIRAFRFMLAETGRWVNPSDDIVDPARILNIVAISGNWPEPIRPS